MDTSIEGAPLSVGGKRYRKGIGTHAVSSIVYTLRPEYRRFVAVVGNDGEVSMRGGSMVYRVFADDTLLAQTPLIEFDDFWHVDVKIPRAPRRSAWWSTTAGTTSPATMATGQMPAFCPNEPWHEPIRP